MTIFLFLLSYPIFFCFVGFRLKGVANFSDLIIIYLSIFELLAQVSSSKTGSFFLKNIMATCFYLILFGEIRDFCFSQKWEGFFYFFPGRKFIFLHELAERKLRMNLISISLYLRNADIRWKLCNNHPQKQKYFAILITRFLRQRKCNKTWVLRKPIKF